MHALNNLFAVECIGREWEGVSCLFISCTCKFLTYTANMLFSLLLCYFEGRLRSAGSSSPPSLSLSLALSLCLSPLSHPTLNQALCNSRLFISARNNWQHFWHILGILFIFFCFLMSVREAVVGLCPETWPKVYGWECGLLILYFSPVSLIKHALWKFMNLLICSRYAAENTSVCGW